MGAQPEVSTHNTTNPVFQGAQGEAGSFLQGIFGGQNPFAGMSSPLQQQAVGNMGSFMNQQAPEMQVFNQMQSPLMQMMGQGAMQNPFGDLGAFNQAQQVNQAAQPLFQQNLAAAQGNLASQAPGRFSSAFVGQGNDLASRALQDFNLFQQQNLMQGLGLQQQGQQTALNFMLGAGGLQQQGALGAGGLLGQLAGQAGQNPFNRALGAGQLGNQITQGQVNPYAALLGQGLGGFGPMDTIVRDGGGPNWGGGVSGGLGGAATGATIGSMVPGIGTAVGAGAGGLIGLLGGLFG